MYKKDYSHSFSRQFITIFIAVAAYWIVSISAVFINKRVLTFDNFDVPIFISWFQSVITVFCLFGVNLFRYLLHHSDDETYFGSCKLHLLVTKLTVVFIGMILFNNFALKLVPVAFYNVVRALSTVFNMIFTRVILKEKISMASLCCCLVVIFGFVLGVMEERAFNSNVSFVAIFIGMLSSMCVSLFAILTKLSLKYVNNNAWLLQSINNINAVILFIPLIYLLGDSATILHSIKYSPPSYSVWVSLILSGAFGFLVGITSNFQIKYTSPLTHNISGTAKAYVQTVLAVYFYGEKSRSFLWWFSNLCVIGGSAAYSFVKSQEMLKANQART